MKILNCKKAVSWVRIKNLKWYQGKCQMMNHSNTQLSNSLMIWLKYNSLHKSFNSIMHSKNSKKKLNRWRYNKNKSSSQYQWSRNKSWSVIDNLHRRGWFIQSRWVIHQRGFRSLWHKRESIVKSWRRSWYWWRMTVTYSRRSHCCWWKRINKWGSKWEYWIGVFMNRRWMKNKWWRLH
jgi:hypothetical protein